MKIIRISLLFIIILISPELYSQFYIEIKGGYGDAAVPHYNENFYYATQLDFSESKNQYGGVSLHDNWNIIAGTGYSLNNNTDLGINISYISTLFINCEEATDKYYQKYIMDMYGSNMIVTNPYFQISTGKKKIKPYLKCGAVFGFGKITNYSGEWNELEYLFLDSEKYYMPPGKNSNAEWKYYGGIAFGFTANIGMSYALNDNINFIGELGFCSLSYTPTKGKLINDNVRNIDTLSVYETNIDFVNRIKTVNYLDTPTTEPKKQLKQTYVYDNVSFTIGVRYRFNKKKTEKED